MGLSFDQFIPDRKQGRGKLKIFLGMCAGVGKTYAMLSEARQRLADGADIVIGYVETHNRVEVTALLNGLSVIQRMKVSYRGVLLEEMDLDALIERKPQIAIVDELAHTNAEGCRHTKRYQDVLELLDAGIDVYTALNVQHIESRVDVVQGIFTVSIRETVPDSILDNADDIQLIDITPEDLLARLAEGKVYLKNRAATAADHFFKIENLSALREIAIRVMSEKVGQDVRDAMVEHHIKGPWKSSERFLVAVGPSPFSEPLIRWTRRIAAATHSPWMAVHVDTFRPLSQEEQQRLSRNLSLVKQLGGETVTIAAEDVPSALIEVAREKNVTQMVVGKPLESSFFPFFPKRSLVDKLILISGDIDICVVKADKTPLRKRSYTPKWNVSVHLFRELGFGCGIIALITAFFWLIRTTATYTSISLFYLLSIVFLATRLSRRAIFIVAALTGLVWNFLFIPPLFTFRIDKLSDWLMLGMYFVVALVVGQLTSRLRLRELTERMREQRTGVLYKLAQCVVESHTLDEGMQLAVAQIDSVFECRSAVTLEAGDGSLQDSPHAAGTWGLTPKESSVVSWVFGSGKPAGRFTETLPQSKGIHVPLRTTHGIVGVLSLLLQENAILDIAMRELLETVSDHVAALVDRYNLIRQSHIASLAQESEKLHKVIFDCLSHELKTPMTILTAASGQAGACLEKSDIPGATFALNELSIAILRLRLIVDNLLGMTRMESEQGKLEPVWCDLEEIVEAARNQVETLILPYRLRLEIPDNLPMIQADPILLTHVVSNLLANATQYSPQRSTISIFASSSDAQVTLKVIDEGEGIPVDELGEILFQKFHRGKNARFGGIGLGLSIVHRFMAIIGGSATLSNRTDRSGAVFTLVFPLKKNDVETL
ncbi:MAG: sensor histidine kinase KdpD [Desulfobacula sp.]|jgi:two-component system sensor histidine kinase KdpD